MIPLNVLNVDEICCFVGFFFFAVYAGGAPWFLKVITVWWELKKESEECEIGKKMPVKLPECTDVRYFIISMRLRALF